MTLKLLIAEDTRDLANAVAFAARMAWPGCQVTIASDGEDALARFAADPADLVVLDVGMPPPNGFEVCRRIREVSEVPILMLTVRDATVDKVRALDLGADDYLTKPFDHLELLLRRAPGQDAQPTPRFVSGELSIDFSTHEVRLGEEVVRLTTTEYRLLEELARHAGVVMPHDVLLERVWGAEWITQPNYLKVFIQRLRRKLGEDAENPRYIQTEWGIGYRFVHPH